MDIKTCRYCQITSDLVKFYSRWLRGKMYYANICILCHKENSSLYYERNRLKRNRISKNWYYANKEYVNKILTPKSRNKRRIAYNEYIRSWRMKNKKVEPKKEKKLKLTQILKIPGKRNNKTHPWILNFWKNSKSS